jgi:hypothetical protein
MKDKFYDLSFKFEHNVNNNNKILNSNPNNNILIFNFTGLQEYNKILNIYVSNWGKNFFNIKKKVNSYSNIYFGLLPKIKKVFYLPLLPSGMETNENLNILKSKNYLDLYSESREREKQNIVNSTHSASADQISKLIKSISLSSPSPAIPGMLPNGLHYDKWNEATRLERSIKILPKITVFTFSQQINYNFNYVNNILIKKIYCLLFYSFISMNSLISKPIFKLNSEKVIIHLFIFLFKQNKQQNRNTIININRNKIKILCLILSRLFNKPVELNLNRIYYPYFDSNIFVNFLANIINKIQVRKIYKKFLKKAIIKNPFKLNRKIIAIKLPSLLSGIKFKFAGRVLTQKVIPKKTINIVSKGALARIKINYLDKARYTNKNKRGAFSITITTGQFLT